MSALGWPAIGIAVIAGLCFLHSRITSTMPRAKLVVCMLLLLGALEFIYVGYWILAGQHPLFSLKPALYFGTTMWVSAMLYSTIYVLRLKDNAPSK